MRATLRSIYRFRDALSQIGGAVSASAEYTRLSAGRADCSAVASAHEDDSREIHFFF